MITTFNECPEATPETCIRGFCDWILQSNIPSGEKAFNSRPPSADKTHYYVNLIKGVSELTFQEELIKIGQDIEANSGMIATDIQREFKRNYDGHFTKISEANVEEEIAILIQIFADGLQLEDGDQALERIHSWGERFGKRAAEIELSAEKAMLVVPVMRKELYRFIRSRFKEERHQFADYYTMADRLNPLIDGAIYSFTRAYTTTNEAVFEKAQKEIMELSVPVVPLTAETAILPVIGSIDTKRAEELMNQSLERSRELQLSTMIIDLSGVHMIDTYVAQNLYQLHEALRITGVTVVFSGMRPELAQTIVSLGIRFDDLTIVSSLQQALHQAGLKLQE